MKKKVKKFSRGGDILTGLGAGLLGYAAYKHFTKDDQGKDTNTGIKAGTDYGEKVNKAKEAAKAAVENKKDAKESDAKEGDRKADDTVEVSELKRLGEFPYVKKDGTSGARLDEYVNKAKPVVPSKTSSSTTSSNTSSNTRNNAEHAAEINQIFRGVNDPNKGKYKTQRAPSIGVLPGKNAYVDSSGVIYNERGDPFAQTDKKADKKSNRRSRGFSTAGDPNAKGSTQKGRSENPIQGTIDNAGRSTVRSDKDKMRERALEVERRRQKEKFEKEAAAGRGIKKGGMVKKYAAGGSVKASSMGSVKQSKPSMSSASSRGDGIAMRGKTRGRIY
jgi:hypothetical protein